MKPEVLSDLEDAYCDVETVNTVIESVDDLLSVIEQATVPAGHSENEYLLGFCRRAKILLYLASDKLRETNKRIGGAVKAA